MWVNRDGSEEAIPAEPSPYEGLERSPNDDHIAYSMPAQAGSSGVWTYDLLRDVPMQLTRDPGVDSVPVWTPNSERVVWGSGRDGILKVFSRAADGTGEAEALTGDDLMRGPLSFTPDGGTLLVFQFTRDTSNFGLGLLSMDDLTTTIVDIRGPHNASPHYSWALPKSRSRCLEITCLLSHHSAQAVLTGPPGRDITRRPRDSTTSRCSFGERVNEPSSLIRTGATLSRNTC